jgi:hypothetical protein
MSLVKELSVGLLCVALSASGVYARDLTVATTPPIILTIMTHTDGTYGTADAFKADKKKIQRGIELFKPYGVKMNLEASKEFATADITASTASGRATFLKSVVRNGNGVGTHCNDVRASTTASDAALQTTLENNKRIVDSALADQAIHNVSISGICSNKDWVKAAQGATFKITDAGTGFCYLSMPQSARPTAEWTDDAIKATFFHDPAPFDLANRLSPMRLLDATDFVPDAAGILIFSNGELGELDSLHEGRINCAPSCTLDAADFNVVYAAIDNVIAARDPAKVGRINMHIPTKLFNPTDEALLDDFLTVLKAYADAGKIVFGTQEDVADTFARWP